MFSKGNKKNRYQNMFDDTKITNNKPPINNQKKVPDRNNKNIINNNKNNNYNKQKNVNPKGWLKKNYPEFKYQKPKKAANCKVNYGKINYNDYCANNKIDKQKNYHYYRENGYYNYNNAMKNYRIRQNQGQINNNNLQNAMQFRNNNGPRIVNIKK